MRSIRLSRRGQSSQCPGAPAHRAQLASIRSVQITIVARTGQNPSPLVKVKSDHQVYRNQQDVVLLNPGGDNFTRTTLSAQILCRNLGL